MKAALGPEERATKWDNARAQYKRESIGLTVDCRRMSAVEGMWGSAEVLEGMTEVVTSKECGALKNSWRSANFKE